MEFNLRKFNNLGNSQRAALVLDEEKPVVRACRKWQVPHDSPPLVVPKFKLGSTALEDPTGSNNLVNKIQKEGFLVQYVGLWCECV